MSTGDTLALVRVRRLEVGTAARIVALVGVLLFALRGTARLADPRMFAEDGQIFLADSRNLGPAALLEPYSGYLHAVPRLIAAAVEPAPLQLVPSLFAWVATVGIVAMFSPILLQRVAWLLPHPMARAFAFALLLLLPMAEPYGNIANLIFVGGVTLFLLAMSDDPQTRAGKTAELAVVLLLGLSGPVGAIVAPLFVYRLWRNRSAQSLAMLAAVGVAAAVQVAVLLASPRGTPGGGSALLLLQAVSERVAGVWLFGDALLTPAARGVAAVWLVAVLVITVAAMRSAAIAGWFLAASLIGAATWAYGAVFVTSPLNMPRHVLIPLAVVVVMLVATVARGGRAGVAAVVCLALGVGGLTSTFVPAAYLQDTDMAALERCVESGRTPCVVTTYDAGWTITLD